MVILLVHDDRTVLDEIAAVLAPLPQVTCLNAAGVEAAVSLANSWEVNLDAVICPVELDQAEGTSVVAGLRQRFPRLNALYLAKEPAAWAHKLPQELILPADPLPHEAICGWAQTIQPEEVVRSQLGDYDLLQVLRETSEVITYRALQRSVQRLVALEQLKPDSCGDPQAALQFRGMVRAKASVAHQHVAAVYEAQELDSTIFYTREMIDGKSLAELVHSGARLKQDVVLNLLHAAAEAIAYFQQHNIPHSPLTPDDVILGGDGLPRVANIALGEAMSHTDQRAEVLALAQAAHAALDSASPAPEFNNLWHRVRDHSAHGVNSWQDFAHVIGIARNKAAEANAAMTRKLSAGTYAIVMKRRRKKHTVFAAIAAAAALIGAVLFQWLPLMTAPRAGEFDAMVRIPASEFIYQKAETRSLPEFWIDKYEVTIAQYAEFLEHLSHFPGVSYDHPKQPPGKTSHRPKDWDDYYRAARRAGTFQGHPLSVNCPVSMVDFWDAWAYARWKDRRLPTELEWEKAARGTDGRLFPWGNLPASNKTNSGADYSSQAGGGNVDGFSGWAPVDAHPQDASPFLVLNMAGNVSEWTDSHMLHPDLLDQQVPVLRGGSFYSKGSEATLRRAAPSPEQADIATGFRTAADNWERDRPDH